MSKLRRGEALNFHEWGVCKPAMQLGEQLGVSVFRFLREPLIAKYGEDFYRELEQVDDELTKQGYI